MVNPRAGREREPLSAHALRRAAIAVVGGGPAGLEAARALAALGAGVELFEAERRARRPVPPRPAACRARRCSAARSATSRPSSSAWACDVRLGRRLGDEDAGRARGLRRRRARDRRAAARDRRPRARTCRTSSPTRRRSPTAPPATRWRSSARAASASTSRTASRHAGGAGDHAHARGGTRRRGDRQVDAVGRARALRRAGVRTLHRRRVRRDRAGRAAPRRRDGPGRRRRHRRRPGARGRPRRAARARWACRTSSSAARATPASSTRCAPSRRASRRPTRSRVRRRPARSGRTSRGSTSAGSRRTRPRRRPRPAGPCASRRRRDR